MITLLLVAGAIAFLFWPRAGVKVPAADELFRVAPPAATPAAAAPSGPDPRPAIDHMLRVRERLAADGRLDEANTKAVDQLVLELVHGRVEAK